MLISLFSDASLCPRTRKGGWAGWLKSEIKTVRGGGCFRKHLNDTAIAEAMAIVNTLHLGSREKVISEGDTVLVQTDNNSVADVLQGTARRRLMAANMAIADVAQAFATIVDGMRITIRWRHVKAHRGPVDRRSAVNEYCDVQAREHMRRAREDAPDWEMSPDRIVLPEDVGVQTSSRMKKRLRQAAAAADLAAGIVRSVVVPPAAVPTPEKPAPDMRTTRIVPHTQIPPSKPRDQQTTAKGPAGEDASRRTPKTNATDGRKTSGTEEEGGVRRVAAHVPDDKKAPAKNAGASKPRNRPSNARRRTARGRRRAA